MESEVSVISLDYYLHWNTVFRRVPVTQKWVFPKIGTSYEFQSIPLPTKWSMGVTIERGNSASEVSAVCYRIHLHEYMTTLN